MGTTIDFVKSGLSKGYKFDGCTDSPNLNFVDCCNEHDYNYQDMSMSRKEADDELRACMQKKGWVVLPWVYWTGVRIFGGNHFARKQNETREQLKTELVGPSADGP